MAAIEKGEVDGVSQSDPALTILEDKKLIKIMVDTRTMKGNQELFGGSFPAACLYAPARPPRRRRPNTAQALATAIVRADQWLQTAAPADVAKAVPEAYLLGDRALYEKAFAAVRDTISPDGQMPADGPANCLKFLAEGDPAIKPGKHQARRHLDQRVRGARRQAQLMSARRSGAGAGGHHLPLRRP